MQSRRVSEILASIPAQIEGVTSEGEPTMLRSAPPSPTAFVGELTLQIHNLREEYGRAVIGRNGLGTTALTDLFSNEYDVDLSGLPNSPAYMRLEAISLPTQPEDSCFLVYSLGEGEKGPMWGLMLDAHRGQVNLTTVGSSMPLIGEGNIALVPGVREALMSDVALLAPSPNDVPPLVT